MTEDPRWADGADRASSVSALASVLGASPLALVDLYRQKSARFGDEALLLVADQFEEIFRYRQQNTDEAESFVKLLLRCASEVPIYVVMTMRSDSLGHCVSFFGLPEAINEGLYLTPRLDAEQIKSVIGSPLALVGGEIDSVLTNRLVNSLGEGDELPVLQHALLRMWNRARALGRTRIGAGDFEAVCKPPEGRVAPPGDASPASLGAPLLAYAIDNHATEIYDALTPQQRGIARQFFLALVERREAHVRRPQTVRELVEQVGEEERASLLAVIDAFRADGAGFVLPAAGEELLDATSIDISHESLFRLWQRFRKWLDEEELDAAELKEWQRRARRCETEGGGWLEKDDCDRAERWRARVRGRADPRRWAPRYTGIDSYEQVERYLQGSLKRLEEARAEREALRRNAEEERLRRVEAEAGLQREAAQRAEAEAGLQREAAQRAEAEKAHAQRDREQAVALADVSRRRSRVAIAAALLASVFGLLAAWFWWQADSARARAEGMTRAAQASELATTAESIARDTPDQSVLLALAARRAPPSAKADALLRAAHGAYPFLAVLRGHEGPVSNAQFSADAKTVATASNDKTARLWDVASGKELRVLRGHKGWVTGAQLSADGKTVATASPDKTARLWDVASGKELRVLRGHEGWVTGEQFSADGKTVVTASYDNTARLWDVASGKELRVLRGHESWVYGVQFSADGKTIVTAGDDGTARLWRCDECHAVDDEMAGELLKWIGRDLIDDERHRFGLNEVVGHKK